MRIFGCGNDVKVLCGCVSGRPRSGRVVGGKMERRRVNMRVLRISSLVLMVLFLVVGISYTQTVEEYYDKGVEYGVQGRFVEAEEEFKKALRIDRFYTPAKECLRLVKDVLEKKVEDEAIIHLFKGAGYGSKGMVDEAIAECKKAIAIDPNYAEAHNNIAVAYYDKGQYDLAIEYCNKAIELGCRVDPGFLEALKPYRK